MPPAEYEGQAQPAPLPSDVKDDLFQGTEVFAKNAVSATEINMGPESLDLVGGSEKRRASTMVLNVVRTYTYDKPGMYDAAEVEKFRSKLNSGDWSCSVRTRDLKNGSSSDICHKRRSDGLRESAIVTVEPKSLTFIHTIRRQPANGSSNGSGLSGFSFSYGGSWATPMIAMADLSELGALGTLDGFYRGVAGEGAQVQREVEQLARSEARIAEGQARMAEGDARMAESQARIAEGFGRMNSPEYRIQTDKMKIDIDTKINSPEMKEKFEKLNREFGSPEFKQKVKDAKEKNKQDEDSVAKPQPE
jgi:hypothetical protein